MGDIPRWLDLCLVIGYYFMFVFTMKRKRAAECDCVKATTVPCEFPTSVNCCNNDDKMYCLHVDTNSNCIYCNVCCCWPRGFFSEPWPRIVFIVSWVLAVAATRYTTYRSIRFSIYVFRNQHSVINEICFIGDYVCSGDVICCMVWACSSRKKRRKRRRRRKKSREGSSYLTKFVKVPNSWFKLRPMANQRKTMIHE